MSNSRQFTDIGDGVSLITEQRPTATYYRIENGKEVSLELPADPYSKQTYLRKGFVLDKSKLKKGVI